MVKSYAETESVHMEHLFTACREHFNLKNATFWISWSKQKFKHSYHKGSSWLTLSPEKVKHYFGFSLFKKQKGNI